MRPWIAGPDGASRGKCLMTIVTHAMTVNGHTDMELKDQFDSPEAVLRKTLSRMDGNRLFALSLWALPNGAELDEVDSRRGIEEYIQAGGSKERMTVEVRRLEPGGAGQYVVGRASVSSEDEALDEVVRWNDHQTLVRASRGLGCGSGRSHLHRLLPDGLGARVAHPAEDRPVTDDDGTVQPAPRQRRRLRPISSRCSSPVLGDCLGHLMGAREILCLRWNRIRG